MAAKYSALAELGEALKKEVPRAVRQHLEEAVEVGLVGLSKEMVKKAFDICHDICKNLVVSTIDNTIQNLSSGRSVSPDSGVGSVSTTEEAEAPEQTELLNSVERFIPDFLLNRQFDFDSYMPTSLPAEEVAQWPAFDAYDPSTFGEVGDGTAGAGNN